MTTTTPRAFVGALAFALCLALVPYGAGDDSQPALLASFHPGAPGEPAWTMLKVVETRSDDQLDIFFNTSQLHCPFVWAVQVVTGSPDSAKSPIGILMTFTFGHGGYEAVTTGPVVMSEHHMSNETQKVCGGTESIDVRLLTIPQGTFYLLEYTAGTPFAGNATVTSTLGSASVVANAAHGDHATFVDSDGFGNGDMHIQAGSPGVCTPDPTAPACQWQGGSILTSAEVGSKRSTTWTFEHHPWFLFDATSRASISNVSVTTPTGSVLHPRSGARVATQDGLSAEIGYVDITMFHTGPDASPGTYDFDLNFNANAGDGATAWTLVAIDFQFPEEVAT